MKKLYNLYGITNVEFKIAGDYGSDYQDISEAGVMFVFRGSFDTLEEAEAYLKEQYEEGCIYHSEYTIKEVYSFK